MTMPRHCIAEHACKCVYALLNPNRCSRQFQYWMFIETEKKEKYIHTHTNISRVRACADEEDMAKMDLHLVGVCEKWNVFATIDSNQINKVESKKRWKCEREKKETNLWQFVRRKRRLISISFFSQPKAVRFERRHAILLITSYSVLICGWRKMNYSIFTMYSSYVVRQTHWHTIAAAETSMWN